ncbi:hypothetical protein SAMN05660209_01714 [Geodermatophilus africanus]|uniref:Stage II sporulation protein E (SpoIIE) n=1 Tax=Geodermatophilus africanus TaxID=1137993 RepID=A0A1H3G324_9ACTN|nr:hypothetical protein SAMN05660209_01714 [Geodermatophilus africanus]
MARSAGGRRARPGARHPAALSLRDIDAGTSALAATLGGLQGLPADAILDRVLDPVRCDREDDIAVLAIRVEG